MITIKEAILKSKTQPNISNGGSACYQFDNVVLVKYVLPLKYVTNSSRARENEEIVKEKINEKALNGVNTPKHLDIFRTVENDNDVCYVLEEKCPGQNCHSMSKYVAEPIQVINDLKYIYNIPFNHYQKLIKDGCLLKEMGYEKKNKNLFYDEKTGFWFIDFLSYDKEKIYKEQNPISIFETLKNIIPNPLQLASKIKLNEKFSTEEIEIKNLLEYSIEAKTLLAIKSVIRSFTKYEKFYLFKQNKELKEYLMKQKIVDKNLFILEKEDYLIFEELINTIIEQIIYNIINHNLDYKNVIVNDIRNYSNLFNLEDIWKQYPNNPIKKGDYEDEDDYEYFLRKSYNQYVLDKMVTKLKTIPNNINVNKFLNEMNINISL